MVNTRSQKRRGMSKRATHKNLKNRNAQTKRRGQQKGGEDGKVDSVIANVPRSMTREEVFGKKKSPSTPENPNLPLTNKIVVLDFDATSTTFAGHSEGKETILLNGKYKTDKNGKKIKIDIFGGKLKDLISDLELLKNAGYTLYINSRSSRCALLKFFGKDENYKQTNGDIETLGNLFTDIYGSNQSFERVECTNMNMKEENTLPTRKSSSEWQKQKMEVINDIITKHGGKENITELYFFDDEEGNITEFNDKFSGTDYTGFKGVTVKRGGDTLFLLNDLDRLLNKNNITNERNEPLPPTPEETKNIPVVITENNPYKLSKNILLLFQNEPTKRIKINNNGIKRGKLNLNNIVFRPHNKQNIADFITYEMLNDKLSQKFNDVHSSGQLSYLSIDPKTLIVSYETAFNQYTQTQHLSEFIKPYLPEASQAGGRKSKSNPKTRTQKRRSTNPKNKRTRKSKK